MVRPPPEGHLILEKGGRKLDLVCFRDWGEGAELLHLEDPCFQGLGFLATEWRWSVWLDTDWSLDRGCDWDHQDLVSLLGDDIVLIRDLILHLLDLCL